MNDRQYDVHLRLNQRDQVWLGSVYVRTGATLVWVGASMSRDLDLVMQRVVEVVEEQEGEVKGG